MSSTAGERVAQGEVDEQQLALRSCSHTQEPSAAGQEWLFRGLWNTLQRDSWLEGVSHSA